MSLDREIARLSKQIEMDVLNNKNYRSFDSSLNMDESALNYTANKSLLDYDDSSEKVIGLSTYNVALVYTPGIGVPAPVTVELFGTNFNNGTIVGNTLVFTNAGGDTVTVTGITSPITAFQDRLRSAPFKVKYVRQTVVNAAQFREQMILRSDSVYGSGKFNTLDPEEFITPEQFQLLRVDVPLNTSFDSERRFIMNVGPTEVAPGTKLTFWVNGLEAPIRKLNGRPSVIDMDGTGIQSGAPTINTNQAIGDTLKIQANTNKMIQNLVMGITSRKI